MTFRREGVPMGLPGLDEWHIQQTDADAVRAAKRRNAVSAGRQNICPASLHSSKTKAPAVF